MDALAPAKALAGPMTTFTPRTSAVEHPERVRAIGAVVTSAVVLVGLLVAAGVVLAQVVDLVGWAFAGR
ncbi:hypothetical protein GCM10022273_31590 [Cellulomonas soli]